MTDANGRRPNQAPPAEPANAAPTAAPPIVAASFSTAPEATAFALAPSGRRALWALIVPDCPWCGCAHLHRATGPHGGLRVAGCGRPYLLRVAGQRRGR